ncbi:MAG: hypothetical protein RJQ00_13905 [Vicingaceae bacterium]
MLSSCSRDKNTALSRAYHNTTSRYNGYFNAREIMREEEEALRENFKDDYTQVLPIFIYPDDEKSQQLYPQMDKVIDKCSEVIDRHSIYLRKKEHVKWIDDSYFLIGKARLYKHEYNLAEETFLYVYQAYKKDPNRYRGLNWLIKTYIETKQYDEAEEFLDIGVNNMNKFPEEFRGHFYAIFADFNLKRDEDIEAAIENLEQAVKLTKEKELRRRYTFILGQLYQKTKMFSLATDRYSRVLRLNPDYIMRFNARINRAIAYDVSGTDGRDIKKELNKMLRDKKNKDFRDQTYFALAEIAIKEDDEPQAIEYLKKSVKYSTDNVRQKAISYLRLANIYFEQPSYVKAQTHFDSTLQYLPMDHPEYYDADTKNNSLIDLVENLKIIKLQDSLIALSMLSEKDRTKKVKELIKNLKAEEERKRQEELRKLQELQNEGNSPVFANQAVGRKGDWYFYNQTTMALGQGDFKSKWGDRVLEDDWRRKKSKSQGEAASNREEAEETPLTPEDSLAAEQKYEPDFYLKDIPKDLKEQLIAHGKVAEALFNVGTIFKESFSDYKNAIASFERITTEYDTAKQNLPAHYQLYRIYKIINEEELAEVEKKWVLDNHPFSEYAYLIKNPNYNKESKETKEKIEDFYAATYRLYQFGLYEDVLESIRKANETFKKNHIQAKFDFLEAKSIGYLKTREEFKKKLEAIVENYPEDPIKGQAQLILDKIKESESAQPAKVETKEPIFEYKPESKHVYVLSADESSAVFQQLKNELSNFNQQYFREQKLSITSSALGSKSLYLVRMFNTQAEAMRYLKALKNNTKLYTMIQTAGANSYLISTENFQTLFKTKNEEEYLQFFAEKYPA